MSPQRRLELKMTNLFNGDQGHISEDQVEAVTVMGQAFHGTCEVSKGPKRSL